MTVVICPGVHDYPLTQEFLTQLQGELARSALQLREPWQVFPAHQVPAYSAFHLLSFLKHELPPQASLTLIGFSAGVVGAIATAWAWPCCGGQIRALIALDGWGVPLYGPFPVHRLSHDHLTHWSSQLWGGDQADSFYADPPVGHLELWRSPQRAQGWYLSPVEPQATQMIPGRADQVLVKLLQRYGELTSSNSG